MALLAVVMCVNFTSCSDDDEEEQGETFSIEGTWLLQSSKGYIESGNNKETWDESYPDLQETKLEITKKFRCKNILSKSIIFKMVHGRMILHTIPTLSGKNINHYPSYTRLLGHCRNKIFR